MTPGLKPGGCAAGLLIEELTTAALTQHDLEAHFAARAARGSVEAGLRVLDALDARDASSAAR